MQVTDDSPCNSREDVLGLLKSWGVAKEFKPYRDPNCEPLRWLLLNRRPAQIVGGCLSGTDIYVDEFDRCFRVWTSQKKLAREIAGEYGLRVRLYDGEAEVWVTPVVADRVLPRFGAKTRQERSEAQKAVLATARANSPIFKLDREERGSKRS